MFVSQGSAINIEYPSIKPTDFLYNPSLGGILMKLIFNKVTMSLLVVLAVISMTSAASAVTETWPYAKDVATDKKWTITFSKAVDRTTVTSDTLYVTSAIGKKQQMSVTYSESDHKVHIAAPTNGYTKGETYTLHISDAIQNVDGTTLKSSITKQFTIAQPSYEVVKVASDGTQTVQNTYSSFAQAAANVAAGQAVVHHGKILYMPKGFVVTKE